MDSDGMMRIYGLRPACAELSRRETTSLLSNELVRLVLEVEGRYNYWAHEVWLDRYTDHEKRVDFVSFMPKGGVTYTDASHVEHGIFSFYEVKSCMADLKSGNGLNFEGDDNLLVMPIELYDPYKLEIAYNPDGYVSERTRLASVLAYGVGRNGRPRFERMGEAIAPWHCRKRAASELLLCMMRAMLANSGDSDVDHRIR